MFKVPPLTFLAPLVVLFNRLARKSSPSVSFPTALLCAKQASAGSPDCQPSTHALISHIYHTGGCEIWYMLRESKTCVRFNNRATHTSPPAPSHTHETWHTRQCVINNFPLNYPCKFRLETNLHFTYGAPPGSLTASASCWVRHWHLPLSHTCKRVNMSKVMNYT